MMWLAALWLWPWMLVEAWATRAAAIVARLLADETAICAIWDRWDQRP